MHYVIAHYHELALKGRNRPMLVDRLVRNIREGLRGLGHCRVESLAGRIRISLEDPAHWSTVRSRLEATFGLANFAPAHYVSSDITAMTAAICETVQGLPFHTFRVTTRRADKSYPLTSMEVDRQVGAAVVERTGAHVSLKDPEMTVFIEVLGSGAYYYCERFHGAGGLPVGMSGTVACLLSGGIDSPVAAWRMMKRGCRAVFIHFHGHPFVTRASADKAEELARHLTRHQYHSRLYLVPFGDIQRQIVLSAPAPLRVVLYRRLMVRIAEEIGRENKCWALVSGDSLGQVASQTARNITVVNEAACLPFLRPLIGMDKVEITNQARKIGTYEISIEPDQDCCRLFVPPHPATQARLEDVQRAESRLDVHGLTKQALEKVELKDFTFPESSARS
jgi:thiamine biosynthesis protein ThiI